MQPRRSVFLKRLGAPGAEAFAVLFALESVARALLATVVPLEAFRLLGDAAVSFSDNCVVGIQANEDNIAALKMLKGVCICYGSFFQKFLLRATIARDAIPGRPKR